VAHPNEVFVRELYAAMNRGDGRALAKALLPDERRRAARAIGAVTKAIAPITRNGTSSRTVHSRTAFTPGRPRRRGVAADMTIMPGLGRRVHRTAGPSRGVPGRAAIEWEDLRSG